MSRCDTYLKRLARVWIDPTPLILGMSWLAEHDPDISWRRRTINFPFDTHCCKHRVATEARRAIQAVSLHAVPIAESDEAASALHLIPDDYKEYLDVFSKASARTLPPHRPGVDHVIKFIDPNKLPVSRLYGRSQEELAAEKAFLEEFEPIGFIRPSDSPVASSSMFAHSPGRPPRLVIDYRAINSNTVKDVYPLPLMEHNHDLLTLDDFKRSRRMLEIAAKFVAQGFSAADVVRTTSPRSTNSFSMRVVDPLHGRISSTLGLHIAQPILIFALAGV